MFAVMLFLATDQVEVVPSSWVREENGASICYWPPYTEASEFLKAIRQQKPKEYSWIEHTYSSLFVLKYQLKTFFEYSFIFYH
jgi:hypothetical protein